MSRPSGPRIRSLKPERWADERFSGSGDAEWRLYDGLVTRSDDEGRQSANPRLIRADIYPLEDRSLDEISELLRRLDAIGAIQLYSAGGRDYLHLPSWPDDQRIDKPTASKLPPPPDHSSQIPREESRNARERSCPPRAPARPQTGTGTGSDRDQTRSPSPPYALPGRGDGTRDNQHKNNDDPRRASHAITDYVRGQNR